MTTMQMKLELIPVPVTDVDRAKAFYTEKIGFNADHDYQVRDDLRFVQLTPPGSACSIPATRATSTSPTAPSSRHCSRSAMSRSFKTIRGDQD